MTEPTRNGKAQPPEGETFEASLARLEEIVRKLEEGEIDLDRSVRLFEEGVALARKLEARLADAEMRVEKLLDASGATAPFEDSPPEEGGAAP